MKSKNPKDLKKMPQGLGIMKMMQHYLKLVNQKKLVN